jgi:dihydroorotate dehydrogenase
LDDIANTVLASGIEGMIVSNTTLARPTNLKSATARESGGLSGVPLFAPSTAILKAVRRRVGNRLTLVGAGGVSSGADVYAKIRAGASLVQLYTAMAYEGPGLITRIKRELSALLARDGFARVADAVGADTDIQPSP